MTNIFEYCGIEHISGAGELKARTPEESSGPTLPGGDVIEREKINSGIFKTYIPNFLYKPPYGYPRPETLPLVRQSA